MRIFTIGFTRRSLQDFIGTLRGAGVRRVIDVRLRPQSQLAGFAKKSDLPYLLRELLSVGYHHLQCLAPSEAIFETYRAVGDWSKYEIDFNALMRQRRVELLPRAMFDGSVLLCSEPTADRCHRRLVAEYLGNAWGGADITHL